MTRKDMRRDKAKWRFNCWVEALSYGTTTCTGDWEIPRLDEIKWAPDVRKVIVTVYPRRDLEPRFFTHLLREAAAFEETSYYAGAGGAIWLDVVREVVIDTPLHQIFFDGTGITVTSGALLEEIEKVSYGTQYRLPRNWLEQLEQILQCKLTLGRPTRVQR